GSAGAAHRSGHQAPRRHRRRPRPALPDALPRRPLRPDGPECDRAQRPPGPSLALSPNTNPGCGAAKSYSARMGSKPPDLRFEAALLTGEMVALTERSLAGTASAAEVETWARQVGRHPFASWIADDLHTCLYNIGDVCRQDLELHLAEIRAGATGF